MCIRDSNKRDQLINVSCLFNSTNCVASVVAAIFLCNPEFRIVLITEPSSNIQVPWNTAPVSYTHLRAHETVLDLVCRLLLEKKKIKRCLLYKSDAAEEHVTYYDTEKRL